MDCAGRVLGEPGARKLLGLLERCKDLKDMREVLGATMPSGPSDKVTAGVGLTS
jgi:hypothetical protein